MSSIIFWLGITAVVGLGVLYLLEVVGFSMYLADRAINVWGYLIAFLVFVTGASLPVAVLWYKVNQLQNAPLAQKALVLH